VKRQPPKILLSSAHDMPDAGEDADFERRQIDRRA
jgi:hypothetical protein